METFKCKKKKHLKLDIGIVEVISGKDLVATTPLNLRIFKLVWLMEILCQPFFYISHVIRAEHGIY